MALSILSAPEDHARGAQAGSGEVHPHLKLPVIPKYGHSRLLGFALDAIVTAAVARAPAARAGPCPPASLRFGGDTPNWASWAHSSVAGWHWGGLAGGKGGNRDVHSVKTPKSGSFLTLKYLNFRAAFGRLSVPFPHSQA